MYFLQRALSNSDCRVERESAAARKDADSERLWKLSEEYTKLQ